MERKLSVDVYASAFLLTVAMFAMAILVAGTLNVIAFLWVGSDVSDISSKASYLNTLILMEENTTMLCPAYGQRIGDISRELEVVGYRLSYLEDRKQASDPALASRYSALEAESYGLSGKIKALCGDNSTLVINLYSADCASCGGESTELLKARDAFIADGGAVKLFSFDIGSPQASALAAGYNVTSVPAVIINGQSHAGFLTAEELKGLMGGRT